MVEEDDGTAAFAATPDYRPRRCYEGVAESSVYADRGGRGRGVGRMTMEALIPAAERGLLEAGLPRLRGERAGPEAPPVGFREVGGYGKHDRLDGARRDVVIVERLIPSNL